MKSRSFISVITLLLLGTASLQAGVVPGRWEKLDSQPPGKEIIVTLKTGDRMECTFKSSGPDDLTVTDHQSGGERSIPKSEVRKIVSRDKYADPAWDGALYGAGVGAAAGLVSRWRRGEPSTFGVGLTYLGESLLGALFGAGLGYIADKVHKEKETEVLYQAC